MPPRCSPLLARRFAIRGFPAANPRINFARLKFPEMTDLVGLLLPRLMYSLMMSYLALALRFIRPALLRVVIIVDAEVVRAADESMLGGAHRAATPAGQPGCAGREQGNRQRG